VTICKGNVEQTRFIRREIWIADPVAANTPSTLAAYYQDHVDPIDLTAARTVIQERVTPTPQHTTTNADASNTTDNKRTTPAGDIPSPDMPARSRQRRDIPTVTLRPQQKGTAKGKPRTNTGGPAKLRVRPTKTHRSSTHTQTLMFQYFTKPPTTDHAMGLTPTIDEMPSNTPDKDLDMIQQHALPPQVPLPTPNRQHITLTTFNVRGLHRSRNDVLHLVHTQSPDILILTETMTQPKSNNPSYGWLKRVMPNYTVHRHGGHSEVLIGIKHDLAIQTQATMLPPCTDAEVNTRCVILTLRQQHNEELTIVATYWPSGNNDDAIPLREKMQEHIRTATERAPGSLILAG
ncbi:MAG: endonuclease/exonuclease/phosphatase family protein, partial [Hydrogenophaga sp.]|uniref:endonuclease/exonuclease/phosphatase family protein n=1 Tax=Hydrogenophaga sp. TaxID=1904254 RepID=UPI00403683BE